MAHFIVTTRHEVEAYDRNHAALLVYQELSIEPTPLRYSVTDASATTPVQLNMVVAEGFVYKNMATEDATAQPPEADS